VRALACIPLDVLTRLTAGKVEWPPTEAVDGVAKAGTMLWSLALRPSTQKTLVKWANDVIGLGATLPCSANEVVDLLTRLWTRKALRPKSLDGLRFLLQRVHRAFGLPSPWDTFAVEQALRGYAARWRQRQVLIERCAERSATTDSVQRATAGANRTDALDHRIIEAALREQRPTTLPLSDLAATLTGFFLGLRPVTLAAMRVADVIVAPTFVRLRVAYEKNAHLAEVVREVVVHGTSASSRWLHILLAWWRVRQCAGPLAPLFLSRQGGELSVSAVTVAVRRVALCFATAAGVEMGRVSGSSLRPGGFTAARLLRYSLSVCCHHFSWHRMSSVTNRYLRPTASDTPAPGDLVAAEFARLMDRHTEGD
jgi:integrase